jgi:hypothetical protein
MQGIISTTKKAHREAQMKMKALLYLLALWVMKTTRASTSSKQLQQQTPHFHTECASTTSLCNVPFHPKPNTLKTKHTKHSPSIQP